MDITWDFALRVWVGILWDSLGLRKADMSGWDGIRDKGIVSKTHSVAEIRGILKCCNIKCEVVMERTPQTYFFDIPAPVSNAYPSNYVSTTKYNIFSFLPLALLRQFKRYANIYFLISTLLQCIPVISPLSPVSAIVALMFVIGLSMTREGYEDWKRYKNDKKSNSSKCIKLDSRGNQKEVQWKDLRPSDLLRIKEDQELPADIIPLVSSSESGAIYLETASLDGEKNLKPKCSVKETQLIYNRDRQEFMRLDKGRVVCIEPNPILHQFQGRLNLLTIQQQIELTQKNLLLRGSILKNTESVIGLVCYTGHNTKIMKNSTESVGNISKVERRLNKLIFGILIFECICCAVSAVLNFLNCRSNPAFVDFLSNDYSCSTKAGISFASYFILYNTFIPISLIVSLEVCKLFQGYFMETDHEMYSYVMEKPMKANSVSTNQELGQIECIMSDKTGTLTCNKMVFKQVVIGKTLFQGKKSQARQNYIPLGESPSFSRVSSVQGLRDSYQKSRASDPFEKEKQDDDFDYEQLRKYLSTPFEKQGNTIEEIISSERLVVEEMMNVITTCHECLMEPKSKKYQGPSPDEVTLVEAASKAGYEFMSISNKVVTVNKLGKEDKFEVLQVFEFDSDRKRMSVIVDHNGTLKLYTKGADSVMTKLLGDNNPFKQFIEESASSMSKKGLRSLYYTVKILPQDIKGRVPVEAEEVEKDLTLLGLTGIQDKLQDFVPETIAALRAGGIKITLLTGDKLETAENISRSCGLINESVTITSDSFDEMGEVYDKVLRNKHLSVLADGSKINFDQNRALLANIIINAQSTILCRVTPGQKAEVVKMVKETGRRTLAIGDGANDCNMILEANVGVGLYGKQGTRAAEVANYSIGEFCLLWKLLLYHGRLNYIRISQMILYFFYKNMVFTMPQFIYSFYNMGSGQSVYLSWSITLYNLAFTLLPIAITSVLETDVYITAGKDKLIEVSEKMIEEEKQKLYEYYPKLYYIGKADTIFTIKNFVTWFILGALQGGLCLMINLYTLTNVQESSGKNSHPMSFYFLEISLCTCIVIIVNIKLALNVQRWNVLLLIGFILTAAGYIFYCLLANFLEISPVKGYHSDLLKVGNFYLAQLLSIFGMLTIDVFLYSISLNKDTIQNELKSAALKGQAPSQQKIQNLDKSAQKLLIEKPKTIEEIEEQQATRGRTNTKNRVRAQSKESSRSKEKEKNQLTVPLINPE